MPKVNFTKLHCLKTEDLVGGDEPRLRILADSNVAGEFTIGNMDPGDIEILDKVVEFNNNITARLIEVDTGVLDPPDFLGQVTIGPNDTDTKGIFALDDAFYVLEWENVTETAPDDTDIPIDDSPGDSAGTNPSVHEISLGRHRVLPNNSRYCPTGIPPIGHGVDTREAYIKVYAVVTFPSANDILSDAKHCAGLAATAAIIVAIATKGSAAAAAIATFKATFYECLKTRVGNTVAKKTKIKIKTLKDHTDWSGH